MARKDLSNWCLLYSSEYSTYNHFLYTSSENKTVTLGDQYPTTEYWDEWELEIIGHPVLLSDVLHYIHYTLRNPEWVIDKLLWDLKVCWHFPSPSIDEQSPETIEYVASLITK